jgi:hypothetical protein
MKAKKICIPSSMGLQTQPTKKSPHGVGTLRLCLNTHQRSGVPPHSTAHFSTSHNITSFSIWKRISPDLGIGVIEVRGSGGCYVSQQMCSPSMHAHLTPESSPADLQPKSPSGAKLPTNQVQLPPRTPQAQSSQ